MGWIWSRAKNKELPPQRAALNNPDMKRIYKNALRKEYASFKLRRNKSCITVWMPKVDRVKWREEDGVVWMKWERGFLRQNWHKRRARNKNIIKLSIIDNYGKSHAQINEALLQCETTSSDLQLPFQYAMNNQELFIWTTIFIMNNQWLRKTLLWSLCINLLWVHGVPEITQFSWVV